MEDSRDISTTLGSMDTAKDSLDEKTTAIGEGQYEHALQPLPSLLSVCSSSFSFFLHASIFPYLILPITLGFTTVNLSSRGKDRHPLGLVVSGLDHSCPQVLGVSPLTQMWLLLILL